MLKKRAEVSHVPRIGHLMCSRFDTWSEALSNDRVYSRHSFGKGSCHAGIGRGQHSELQTKPPAWHKPYAEGLLETNFERL